MSKATQRYHLEVYDSPESRTPVFNCESDHPFQSIQRGDLLRGQGRESAAPAGLGTILRVTAVEHFVWESPTGEMRHKLMVIATEVPNTPDERARNVA